MLCESADIQDFDFTGLKEKGVEAAGKCWCEPSLDLGLGVEERDPLVEAGEQPSVPSWSALRSLGGKKSLSFFGCVAFFHLWVISAHCAVQ